MHFACLIESKLYICDAIITVLVNNIFFNIRLECLEEKLQFDNMPASLTLSYH